MPASCIGCIVGSNNETHHELYCEWTAKYGDPDNVATLDELGEWE